MTADVRLLSFPVGITMDHFARCTPKLLLAKVNKAENRNLPQFTRRASHLHLPLATR